MTRKGDLRSNLEFVFAILRTDSRDGGYYFTELKLVENGCLTSKDK
jgi:hypothetical protein